MRSDLMAELKRVAEFKDVPDEQLQWLIDHGECNTYEEGEIIFKPGHSLNAMIIVLEGEFSFKITRNNQHRTLGKVEAYNITGLLPYSRAKEARGYGEITKPTQVLLISKEKLQSMISECHELTTVLVHKMSTRIRDNTKREQQDDKIMALGKLSAGLAHELNNPSAAVIRSSQALKKHLGFLPDKFKAVMNIKVTPDQVDTVNDVIFAKVDLDLPQLGMMERSEKVDELMDWLDDRAIDDSDELAENFVDFHIEPDDLDQIAEHVPEENLPPVIDWMNQVLTTEKLVGDLEEASKRINDLVSSVKSYTHMDQAQEKVAVNIHKGIENTITMLNHKIRKGSIDVIKKYDDHLPEPEILASEMNQVWTNLIDNAVDAMEDSDQKELTIETVRDNDFVNINISDTGSGIPDDIKDQIFDPFFTTKPIGQGTGLGLEVVQQIITVQHNGAIYLNSQPGHTTFKICIPIKAA